MRKWLIFIFTLLTLICLTLKVFGEKTSIKILLKKPDMLNIEDNLEWEIRYNELMNNYFMEKNADNSDLKQVKLIFDFYNIEYGGSSKVHSEYYNYTDKIINYLKYGEYDMVVLDDRILFNDISLIETNHLVNEFGYMKPSLELLMDMTKYVKNKNFDYHNLKVLKDGIYKDKVYGLPYEIDFDLLYYYNNIPSVVELVKRMNDITWDEIVAIYKDSGYFPLTMGLNDDDDLLNLMIEYASNHYNLMKEYDSKYFKVFYNETGQDLFNKFYDFIINYTNDEPYYNTLYINQEDAIKIFIEKKAIFFKGKATHNDTICYESYISSTLPPKYITTVIEKYIVINKQSNIDYQLLTEVAYQLTSKDMQIFRAKHLNTIPTFDISKREIDEDINRYCQIKPDMCNILEKMKPLYIKDIFNVKYGTSYYEIATLLPTVIRNYIMNHDISLITFALKNNDVLISMNMGKYKILSYLVACIPASLALLFIIFVSYHRWHPYIRVMSPSFCIMIISGMVMNIFKIFLLLPPYSIPKTKFYFIYITLNTNLIYIPMFAVIYKIYNVYQSKSRYIKSLTDNQLLKIIGSIILVTILYRIIIIFTCDFYYISYGDILDPRFPVYGYSNYNIHNTIYQGYLYFIVFILLLFKI